MCVACVCAVMTLLYAHGGVPIGIHGTSHYRWVRPGGATCYITYHMQDTAAASRKRRQSLAASGSGATMPAGGTVEKSMGTDRKEKLPSLEEQANLLMRYMAFPELCTTYLAKWAKMKEEEEEEEEEALAEKSKGKKARQK